MSLPTLGLLLGALSALPLLIGAWIALERRPSSRLVGYIAAFGAGALISAVAYELVMDAVDKVSPEWLGLALAAGALFYFAGSEYLEHRSGPGSTESRGLALLMGAALDGIPESFILGISLATGGGFSLPFLLAVIVSNLPEGMTSAAELDGESGYGKGRILGMWAVVVGISAVFAALGAKAGATGATSGAAAQAFAAGALLTMLTDDLIPEARERAGLGAGLAAVLGFAVALALHELGG